MRLIKTLILIIGFVVAGCGEQKEDLVLTMTVAEAHFNIIIPAKGELRSVSEVPINAPSKVRSSLTLSWLKEENSIVTKGEIVALFDGEPNKLKRDEADLEFQKIQITKNNTENNLDLDQFSIKQQTIVIEDELAMTNKFAIEDLSFYSKNEVIDQLLNKDYLLAKNDFLDWSKDSKIEQGNAQIALLSLKGKGHSEVIDMHNSALNQLEVKAPQDGLLIHAKNWRGEKIREGTTVWPGSKLASIPSLDKMQAKIYVLENEAAGIVSGQIVELIMDAYPDRALAGKITNIASIATPRQQQSPVKYFEIIASLDHSDASFMKPGQKVSARIIIHRQSNAISLPNQVIFQKDNKYWVYVKRNGLFDKQDVVISKRSLTKSLLASGIEEGDEVALVEPPNGNKS